MFCFDCEHEWNGTEDDESCPNCGSTEISLGGAGDPDDESFEEINFESGWSDEDDSEE